MFTISFKTNKSQQINMNDTFLNCSERTMKAVNASWANNFYELIISNIHGGIHLERITSFIGR